MSTNFNPRSPQGERLGPTRLVLETGLFQSTLSVRRATSNVSVTRFSRIISIHALRKESDRGGCGVLAGQVISIHALRKESDPRSP